MPVYPLITRIPSVGLPTVLFMILCSFVRPVPAQERAVSFGGTYSGLDADQVRLVDDFAQELSKIVEKEIPPDDLYNRAAQGSRTTFEAVTNALTTSELTDDSGRSLGRAIDLVESVQGVNGKVPGARGDLQFRIYVLLRPGALETLKASREFQRSADNTVYHKGYPICFRQTGGAPSIQISISEDERRADIDVDYRSSKFPVALFNGHLTASNSDVRAGDNFSRHTNRWTGLVNWWRGWFGLPLLAETDSRQDPDQGLLPTTPRTKKRKPQDAVKDFLEAWLVEQKPDQAIAYVDDEALECTQASDEEFLAPALIRFRMLKNMIDANRVLGSVDSLEAVSTGVRFPTAFSRVVRQPYHQRFVLYDIPADRAETLRCAARDEILASVPKSVRGPYGRFYGSAFYLNGPAGRGATLYLLWARKNGYWKVVSFARDIDASQEMALGTQEVPPSEAPVRIEGDPEIVRAVSEFMNAWLVKKDIDSAFQSVSKNCYPCINLFLPEGESPRTGADQMAERLRAGLSTAASRVAETGSLEGVVEAVDPVHPAARILTQPHETGFSLFAIPNDLGKAVDCTGQYLSEGLPDQFERKYGEFYVASFGFRTADTTDSPVFQLLWGREKDAWKIQAYRIVLP